MTGLLYDIALRLLQALLALVRLVGNKDKKLHKFATGQKHAMRTIEDALRGEDRDNVFWFHAASLGEYNVIRPIIQRLKERRSCRVVLTFFSPTGVEALTSREKLPPCIDHVFYLPLDTRRNARRFLRVVRPQKAIFAVSEYWVNYLGELKRQGIPAFLVSGCIGDDSILLKWYGRWFYGKALRSYHAMMVLDDHSKSNLESLGLNNVVRTGDPLFDTAISVAATKYHDEKIERFCAAQHPVFIAGSIHDRNDLRLVGSLANRHRDVKFIFVPHEIRANNMELVKEHTEGKAVAYSEIADGDDLSDVQILVIDFLGALSRIYRFGHFAYVGGGFTPYLHSVIEATVYGLPVAFGPNIKRKVTPRQLQVLGIGRMVRTEDELDNWLSSLKNDGQALQTIRQKAREYTQQNSGATEKVTELILSEK